MKEEEFMHGEQWEIFGEKCFTCHSFVNPQVLSSYFSMKYTLGFWSFFLFLLSEGLNSILFAINIDNKDLNGQSKCTPTVSDLLKESTQNVTSLLKESTQGVSSLLREITASSAVSILMKPDQDTDPLPVLSKNVNAGKRFCNVSVHSET